MKGNWIIASELKEGMKLLSRELNKVLILSINEEILPSEIDVFNLNVQDNHNYFAEGVLVHNAGEEYEKKEVILKAQIFSLTTESQKDSLSKGENSSDYDLNRINQLEALSKSYDDLITITKQNTQITATQQSYAIENLQFQQRIIRNIIQTEQMEIIYNRPAKKTVQMQTNALLIGKISTERTVYETLQTKYSSKLNEILSLKVSIQKAVEKVQSHSLAQIVVKPSWVGGILLDESIRRGLEDTAQDISLKISLNKNTPKEVYERFYEANRFTSFGSVQMNWGTALDILDKGFIQQPDEWVDWDDTQKTRYTAEMLLDPQRAPQLVAGRIQQIYEH